MHTSATMGRTVFSSCLFNLSGNPCHSGYTAAEEHGTKNPISLTICVTTSPPPYPALDKAHGEASRPGYWDSRLHWCEGEGPPLFQVLFGSREQIRRSIAPILIRYVQSPGFLVAENLRRSTFFLSEIQVNFGFGVLYKQSFEVKDENKPNVFCLTYAEKLGKNLKESNLWFFTQVCERTQSVKSVGSLVVDCGRLSSPGFWL